MNEDLKPCPHCGGRANLVGGSGLYSVTCAAEFGDKTCDDYRISKAEAVTAWNTRALPPEVKALVEAAEKMAAILDHISMAAEQATFDCVEESRAALAAVKVKP